MKGVYNSFMGTLQETLDGDTVLPHRIILSLIGLGFLVAGVVSVFQWTFALFGFVDLLSAEIISKTEIISELFSVLLPSIAVYYFLVGGYGYLSLKPWLPKFIFWGLIVLLLTQSMSFFDTIIIQLDPVAALKRIILGSLQLVILGGGVVTYTFVKRQYFVDNKGQKQVDL